jgi:hypothetical protein
VGIKSEATIRLRHIVSRSTKVNLTGSTTTTTRYREFSFPYSRPASGIETVPLTCPYEGCGAKTSVRIAGRAQAQQGRNKLLGIAAIFGLVLLLDLLAVFTLSTASVMWGLAFFALFLFVPATAIMCGVALSYAGQEGWDKIGNHIVSLSNKTK